MFYRTDFEVKYNNIEKELCEKLSSGLETDYDRDDLALMVDHLYQHEFLTVFYATDVFSDAVDRNMNLTLDAVKQNNQFLTVFNEARRFLSLDVTDPTMSPDKIENFQLNTDYMIFLTFFSQNVFYLTHPIICKMLCNEIVDDSVLESWITTIKVSLCNSGLS